MYILTLSVSVLLPLLLPLSRYTTFLFLASGPSLPFTSVFSPFSFSGISFIVSTLSLRTLSDFRFRSSFTFSFSVSSLDEFCSDLTWMSWIFPIGLQNIFLSMYRREHYAFYLSSKEFGRVQFLHSSCV